MIGGVEVQFTTSAGDSSVETVVRVIKKYWDHAVFENGLSADRYDYFWQIPFGEIEEIFVYQNSDLADKWDSEGAIPELCNTMIHIVSDKGMLTVVVDKRDVAMNGVFESIGDALQDEKYYVLAEVEREAA